MRLSAFNRFVVQSQSESLNNTKMFFKAALIYDKGRITKPWGKHTVSGINQRMTGIILTGGRNTRMGANKAFLEADGIRLIDRTLDLYRRLFDEIILVTNDPLAYLDIACASIVTDIYKNKGPLAGIYTGLHYAKNTCSFVSACDMPFLSLDFIEYMIGRADKHDIVVPRVADGFQPLHALYSRACLPSMKKLLEADRLKVTGFYRDMRVLEIDEQQILPFNPEGRLFANVNTPEDAKALRAVRAIAPSSD